MNFKIDEIGYLSSYIIIILPSSTKELLAPVCKEFVHHQFTGSEFISSLHLLNTLIIKNKKATISSSTFYLNFWVIVFHGVGYIIYII